MSKVFPSVPVLPCQEASRFLDMSWNNESKQYSNAFLSDQGDHGRNQANFPDNWPGICGFRFIAYWWQFFQTLHNYILESPISAPSLIPLSAVSTDVRLVAYILVASHVAHNQDGLVPPFHQQTSHKKPPEWSQLQLLQLSSTKRCHKS